MKEQINRIIKALKEIGEAESILAHEYGIKIVENYHTPNGKNKGSIQIYCGIDDVAKAIGKEPKEERTWCSSVPHKKFSYKGVEILQRAHEGEFYYKKAWE